jgi:hypothetical protein
MLYKKISQKRKEILIYISGNPTGVNMDYTKNRMYFIAITNDTLYPIDEATYQYFTNDPFYEIIENLKKGKYAVLLENLTNEVFAYA